MRIVVRGGTAGLHDSFVELPHEVYGGDPFWIPEEEAALRRAFSADNPWFASGSAVTMSIPGRARLAVFRPHGCVVDGRPAAWFGYFESMNDRPAAMALLAEAAAWARRQGADVLYGPIDFNTLGKYRVRVSAEPNAIPFPGEPYNPAYYVSLLDDAGFSVAREYVTQIGRIKPQPLEAKRAMALRVGDAGYRLEPLDGETWLATLPELHRKADEIFSDSFAYTPVSYEQFASGYGASVAMRLCARTSLLARGPDGDLAGFFLVYPHYGPLAMQGSALGRVPVSALSYDAHDPVLAAAGESLAVAKTVGVCPKHRGRGLMDALGASVIDRGVGRYDCWVGAMIRADNPSRKFGAAHMDVERSYALYQRTLGEAATSRGGNAADD
jgi:hypothetical protein